MLYRDMRVLHATINPASVNPEVSAEELFTVTGLVLGEDEVIAINKPTHDVGVCIVGWRVSADNQLGITFMNVKASGAVNPPSETYTLVVVKPTGVSGQKVL